MKQNTERTEQRYAAENGSGGPPPLGPPLPKALVAKKRPSRVVRGSGAERTRRNGNGTIEGGKSRETDAAEQELTRYKTGRRGMRPAAQGMNGNAKRAGRAPREADGNRLSGPAPPWEGRVPEAKPRIMKKTPYGWRRGAAAGEEATEPI